MHGECVLAGDYFIAIVQICFLHSLSVNKCPVGAALIPDLADLVAKLEGQNACWRFADRWEWPNRSTLSGRLRSLVPAESRFSFRRLDRQGSAKLVSCFVNRFSMHGLGSRLQRDAVGEVAGNPDALIPWVDVASGSAAPHATID